MAITEYSDDQKTEFINTVKTAVEETVHESHKSGGQLAFEAMREVWSNAVWEQLTQFEKESWQTVFDTVAERAQVDDDVEWPQETEQTTP